MYKLSDFKEGHTYTIKMRDKLFPRLMKDVDRFIDLGCETIKGPVYRVVAVTPLFPLPDDHLNVFLYVWNTDKNIHHFLSLLEMESIFDEDENDYIN